MKTRVLFISHMYPNDLDYSYGKVIHEQALSLIEYGYEVCVVCPIPYSLPFGKYLSINRRNISKIPPKEIHNNIEVYYPRYISFPKAIFFSQSGKLMYYGIFKNIKKIKETFNFDIIHAHFGMPDTYAANKLSKLFKKPLVSTIQATDLDITIGRSKSCKFKVSEALKSSAQVIAPTPRLQAKLEEILEIKSEAIGYGIDPEKVLIEKSPEIAQKYKNKIIILSVSRIIKSKGLEYNIYAIKKLKEKYNNIKYLIVGDGPERENLEILVKNLNLEEVVEFLGELPSSETINYIAISHIFSLPSWQETFGLVYVEAMINEKVVIGCEGQGFDGIIIDGLNGFLAKPKDTNSIFEIIEFVIENPSVSEKIGLNAKKTVLDNFTFATIAKKIDSIYRKL